MLCVLTAELAAAQPVRSPEMDTQFHRAETAFRTGSSLLEAKARIDRVVSALPEDIEALKLRAQILIGMQRPDEALADARRAVRIDAKDGEAYLILSEAAHAANDTAAGRAAVTAGAPILPRQADFHLRLARCAVWVNELEQAEQLSRTAVDLAPTNPMPHYQLASVLILQGRRGEALDVLVNGLRGGLLDASVVRRDSVLSQVAGHDRLTDLLDQ